MFARCRLADVDQQAQQQQSEMSDLAFSPQTEPLRFPLSPTLPAWLHHADGQSSWPPSSPLVPADTLLPCDSSASQSSSTIELRDFVAAEPVSPPTLAVLSPSPSPSSTFAALSPSAFASAEQEAVTKPLAALSARPVMRPAEQHRDADVRRRRRENAIVRRLDQLCGAAAARGVEGGDEPRAPPRRTRDRQKRKRNKLTVLEASAAHIERLEELLNASELANRMSEAQVRLLNDEIGAMVARERQSLQRRHAADVLHGAGMLQFRFACTMVDCSSGRLLDANSAFYTLTGFTPSGVLQRVLHPTSSTPPSDLPLVRAKRHSHASRDSRLGQWQQSQQWVAREECRQYPGTIRLMCELKAAQRDSFCGPFRCRNIHGVAYEIQGHFWVAEVEWVCEEDGRRWKRPLSFMAAASIDDCCIVEDN